jgi:hypothetical protein
MAIRGIDFKWLVTLLSLSHSLFPILLFLSYLNFHPIQLSLSFSPFRYDGFFLSMLATSVYPFSIPLIYFFYYHFTFSIATFVFLTLQLIELLLQLIGSAIILVHTHCTYGLW